MAPRRTWMLKCTGAVGPGAPARHACCHASGCCKNRRSLTVYSGIPGGQEVISTLGDAAGEGEPAEEGKKKKKEKKEK